MTQMLELSDMDFKAAIKMLQWAYEHVWTNEKESHRKETEDMKKRQMEI